jgi:hypothetical protein
MGACIGAHHWREDLWRTPLESPKVVASSSRALTDDLGQTHVCQLCATALQQDVGRFYVAVDNFLPVEVAQAYCHIESYSCSPEQPQNVLVTELRGYASKPRKSNQAMGEPDVNHQVIGQ